VLLPLGGVRAARLFDHYFADKKELSCLAVIQINKTDEILGQSQSRTRSFRQLAARCARWREARRPACAPARPSICPGRLTRRSYDLPASRASCFSRSDPAQALPWCRFFLLRVADPGHFEIWWEGVDHTLFRCLRDTFAFKSDGESFPTRLPPNPTVLVFFSWLAACCSTPLKGGI